MSTNELFAGGLSGTLAMAALGVLALYLARAPIQRLIHSACIAIGQGLRFASRSIFSVRTRLVARNREV
ncbi:MAG: hypothetical protein AAGI89_07145, partial [Pseudomonadota bacterium]